MMLQDRTGKWRLAGMFLVSAAEMQKLDLMVQEMGVPALILMENAGRALAAHCEDLLKIMSPGDSLKQTESGQGVRTWPGHRCKPGSEERAAMKEIAILAGPGRNGGDGFCAGRHLSAKGYGVKVAFFGDKERLPREAFLNYEMLEPYPVQIYHAGSLGPQRAMAEMGSPDLIIDALLGTGAGGNPRPPMDLAIRWANSRGVPVVACDIPSGLSADTGHVHDPCIKADLTVSMGFAKTGLVSYPGRMFAGDIVVENLGFPPDLVKGFDTEVENNISVRGESYRNEAARFHEPMVIMAQAITRKQAQELLPRRRADHHKGLSGHVTVIAGSQGMAGAAVLAAKSALRSGAGTVTLICPGGIYHVCASMVPEVMVVPCGDSGVFTPDRKSISIVGNHLLRAEAVVVGPGWGRGSFQSEFLKEILPLSSKKICVVDADALYALGQLGGLSYLAHSQGKFILTPHSGELASLIDLSVDELETDRPGFAKKASRESGSVMCLKGAGTCIAGPFGQLFINTSGGPYMATAGSGDVLAGTIAALAAQGLLPLESALVGVFWHGLAGETALKRTGSFGILAGDIIESLPGARALIEQKRI
jgi:hydroxyethylthiazole kinase-like uncharacterized protein yjeF